jgi:hypothetical protein
MYIEIDLSAIPPVMALGEPDDFTSFKIVVREVEHARVPVDVLEDLAGERAADPAWRQGLKKMLDYAQQHGWVDERGVRAHIERPS